MANQTTIAPLATTNFETDPSRTDIVVDPFGTDANALNTTRPSITQTPETTVQKLPTELSAQIINDRSLNTELDQRGESLDQYISAIEVDLPSALPIREVLRENNIQSLRRDVTRVRTSISRLGGDPTNPRLFRQTLQTIRRMENRFDVNDYVRQLTVRRAVNRLAEDDMGIVATTINILGEETTVRIVEDIYDRIQNSSSDTDLVVWSREEMLFILASRGAWASLYHFIQSFISIEPNYFETFYRKGELIKTLLSSSRQDNYILNFTLSDTLTLIDEDWFYRDFTSPGIIDLDLLRSASSNTLNQLRNHTVLNGFIAILLANAIQQVSLEELIAAQFGG